MEIKYIKEFVKLVQRGSFTETAAELHISQSVLSKHIKILETELNVNLMKRNTRSIKISEYGKLFYPYAEEIIQLSEESESILADRIQSITGVLNVGSVPGLSPYGITDILVKFIKENEGVTVNVTEGDAVELLQLLHEEKCDCAFVRDLDEKQKEFYKIPFFTDKLVAVLPDIHPLANKKELRMEDLRYEAFVLPVANTRMYAKCLEVCKKAGFQPEVAYTCNEGKNIIQMVQQGGGISILNRQPALSRMKNGVVLVDIVPTIETKLSVYLRKDNTMQILNRFISYLKE